MSPVLYCFMFWKKHTFVILTSGYIWNSNHPSYGILSVLSTFRFVEQNIDKLYKMRRNIDELHEIPFSILYSINIKFCTRNILMAFSVNLKSIVWQILKARHQVALKHNSFNIPVLLLFFVWHQTRFSTTQGLSVVLEL